MRLLSIPGPPSHDVPECYCCASRIFYKCQVRREEIVHLLRRTPVPRTESSSFFFLILYFFLASLGLHWASLVAQLIKHPPCNEGKTWGSGRSHGEGKATHSGLENSMDCIVHGVARSRPRPSGFHFGSSLPRLAFFPCGRAGAPL